MRTILIWGMLALLSPVSVHGQQIPATAETVPLTVWSQLEDARAIQPADAGPADVQVIFDPFCPASANLYRKVRQEHQGAAVRWIPVAYYRRESAAVAHALLAAESPFQAMGAQLESLSRPEASRARAPRQATREAVNPVVLQQAQELGAYTPMVFSRSTSGGVTLHKGHYSSAIEQALGAADR